ncbi:MAG: hypothetical protein ABSC51_04870 [Gaiellaceae bacterium]|jgi:hypothetical protein
MKSTASPRVRFLAMLALVVVAGGVAFVLLNGSGASNSSASGPTLTRTTPTTSTTSQTTTTKKPTKKPKRNPPSGGAVALDAALIAHPVVVVSVYSPSVATGTAAMNEAKAGAAIANAGFATFNIYDEKQARQLADLLGSDAQISNPSVLIFKRPRTLAFELQGFADSQVVAQATENVYPHVELWVSQANRICARYQAESTSIDVTTQAGRSKGRRQLTAALEKAATLLNQEAADFEGVRVNVGKAASFARLVADFRKLASNFSSEAKAVTRKDGSTVLSIETENSKLMATASALAARLQLTGCA